MAPPALPAPITAVFRAGFVATMKDAALVAETEKANLELDWASGEQLQKLVAGVFEVSPEVVAKAAALSK